MLRMLDYKEANRILHSSLSPNNKCIAKGTALDNHADPTPLNAAPYGSFPRNRLVPVSAIDATVFIITFVDGVNGGVIETRNIDYGQPIGNPPSAPTISGYTFTGNWSPTIPATATQSATYTAQYQQDAPTTYTIIFVKSTDGSEITRTTVTAGDTITAPQVPAVTGYTFTGNWSPSLPATATGDATYTAQYQLNTYTITFLDSDGTTVIRTDQVEHGHAIIPPTVTPPTGYTWGGWSPTVPATATADGTYTATYNEDQHGKAFGPFYLGWESAGVTAGFSHFFIEPDSTAYSVGTSGTDVVITVSGDYHNNGTTTPFTGTITITGGFVGEIGQAARVVLSSTLTNYGWRSQDNTGAIRVATPSGYEAIDGSEYWEFDVSAPGYVFSRGTGNVNGPYHHAVIGG